MNTAFARHLPQRRPLGRQRGISMFIVMIVLMLALILVLGGLSVTNLNESLVGNQSDAQRAYSSALALLDAAQRDIRLNGRFCGDQAVAPMGSTSTNSKFPGVKCTRRFPRGDTSVEDMFTLITTSPGVGECGVLGNPNYDGVCISNGPDDPNFSSTTVGTNKQKSTNGARYNSDFLTALDAGNTSTYGGDAKVGGATGTVVSTSPMATNGRYWVEVFKEHIKCVNDGCPGTRSDGAYPFVFRITAMAPGLKGGTVSVLRTYYTPYPDQ